MSVEHPHIAARDDADQHAVFRDDGEAGEAVTPHDDLHLAEPHVARHRDGIRDDGVFKALHAGHHGGLLLDAVVAVDHAHTAFAGHGDGHVSLRHRVHGRGQNRQAEGKTFDQLGRGVSLTRENGAQARKQENIVECKSKLNFCHVGGYNSPAVFASIISDFPAIFSGNGRRAVREMPLTRRWKSARIASV